MKKLLYIIIGLLLLSCSERKEYVEALNKAEALLDEDPDSALQILNHLTTNEKEFSKSRQMKYNLLILQAKNKAYIPITSDSIAKELVRYYDDHGSSNEQLAAHYILGCIYRDLGEAPKAVDSYQEAANRADTADNSCDYKTLSAVYSQMADIYHMQFLLTNEVEALKSASHFCLNAKDTLLSIRYQDKIAGVYIIMNKKDSAEILLQSVRNLYYKHNYIHDALRSSTKLIYLYVENKDNLDKAKLLLDEYEAQTRFFNNGKELPQSQRQYYYYKGLYYEGLGLLDSAEFCYRRQYQYNGKAQEAEPMYKGLLSVFKKRHQADSIAKYAQLYCEANDSSVAKKDREITALMSASYNYTRYQKESLANEAKANRLRSILIFICFLVVIISFIIWNEVKKARAKRIKELNAIKTEYLDATNEYNNNIRTLQLIDASHQEEILSIQKENEILKSRIDVLKNNEGIQEYITKSKQLKESDISKRISYLINHPTAGMRDNDWEQLAKTAGAYFPDLLHDLTKNARISQQEMRTCILLCFSLRESDIAHLLNTSAQRITNAKSTINQKLFGDNSARSLYKNLTSNYNIYTL